MSPLDNLQSKDTINRIWHAANDQSPVSGLTHRYYRYPAMLSPILVRTLIDELSDSTSLVLDPFCGGGTVLVEALARHRMAVGTDINPLAIFIAIVKTTTLNKNEISEISSWSQNIYTRINIRNTAALFDDKDMVFFNHLRTPLTWRIGKAICQALDSTLDLVSSRSRNFARCVILRTAQWAIDGRRSIPSISSFRNQIQKYLEEMLQSAKEFEEQLNCWKAHNGKTKRPLAKIYELSASSLHKKKCIRELRAPDLVITSPPYPGVHILYNRWQVLGRKETQIPQFIAGISDNHSSSYFTFGSRQTHTREVYFSTLLDCFRSLRKIVKDSTIVCQVMSYSDTKTQLPRYLSVLKQAGFSEHKLLSPSSSCDGRLWRRVPNRKWYNRTKLNSSTRNEVVLFHKPK